MYFVDYYSSALNATESSVPSHLIIDNRTIS
jgi:hypothetical protein